MSDPSTSTPGQDRDAAARRKVTDGSHQGQANPDVTNAPSPDLSGAPTLLGAPDGQVRKWRLGIGLKIYLGLFASVAMVSVASLVAYYFLNEIVAYQSRLAEQSIPNLSRVVEVARESTAVVNGAVRLVSATTIYEHRKISVDILWGREKLLNVVEELSGGGAIGNEVEAVQAHLRRVGTLLEEVYQSSARRLDVENVVGQLAEELAEVNRNIEREIVAKIDDQGFYLVEGMRELDDVAEPLAQRDWGGELAYYRDLIEIGRQTNLAGLYLGEALVLADRDLLGPLEERFQSAAYNLVILVARLALHMPIESLSREIDRLREIGESSIGIFALRREILERVRQEGDALAAGRAAAIELLNEVERLAEEVNADAVAVNTQSQNATTTGILVLVLITLASIAGAVLIGWLFVGRSMVRRLVGVAASMGDMAKGDLEAPVVVSGNDEVTDMANSLEVFRRYALEVQRLNLVEKMAQELDSKNQDLEHALERLHNAQEQIVAEEKLSSLGQLAAGVAHEIKNPLNFVKNFTEVSLELIDEIAEILEEADIADDELHDEISAILGDLRTNLNKVSEHSGRADSIVRSMLEHSRGQADDWRETDLNALFKQYRDLAYHAMRAENTDFNATMREELDEDIGLLEVVPQDLSRAFLNILSNAYQAIEEKVSASGEDYEPELVIGSRRLDDGFEFWVRDNGPGIPEELRKHMFEPFVTTKETGKGTGLGLSLTTDIVTRHGGSLSVESEVGEFARIAIRLPLNPAELREIEADTEA